MRPDELQAIEREIAALRRRSDELEARRKELHEESVAGSSPMGEDPTRENSEPRNDDDSSPNESP